ncbi:MAG: hypothetical protein LBC95_01530 [Candidatus Nomurabacteria bacterium]|jgi:hypothetical protein|nr:hypothetical protein [Candidatus Nomurabacteria bacterium]
MKSRDELLIKTREDAEKLIAQVLLALNIPKNGLEEEVLKSSMEFWDHEYHEITSKEDMAPELAARSTTVLVMIVIFGGSYGSTTIDASMYVLNKLL